MNKYATLGKNTFFMAIGNVSSKLIGFIMLPLYTRWMNPDEYGLTDVITVYSQLFLAFVTCCIADAIFVLPKRASEQDRKSYFSSGLLFAIIALIVSGALSFAIDFFSLGEGSFFGNIIFIYLLTAATFIQSFFQQFTLAIGKTLIYSLAGIINTLGIALFSFILVPRWGATGYIVANAIAMVITALFSFLSSKSYNYFDLKSVERVRLEELLKYSIPLLPNSIMWWFVNGMNRPLIIEHIGMYANGLLAVANKLPGIVSMVFAVFSNAFYISVMEEYGKEGFGEFYDNCLKMIMAPTILFASLLAVFSKPIVELITTPEYFDAYFYMPLCVLSVLFSNLSSLLGGIFAARKESKYFFYSSIWGAGVAIITMFTLIPAFKIYGAIASSVISFLAMMVARYLYAKKSLAGVDIRYYCSMILAYTTIALVVNLNMQTTYKIIFYILVLALMLKINYRFIVKSIEIVKHKLINK